MSNELRRKIVEMITDAGEGHIPSAFSVVDLIEVIYRDFLRVNPKNPSWQDRDYFVLSKGHGCAALYVVLEKMGFLTSDDLKNYGKFSGILGGHPDRTKVPGVEASTGSLGHGLPFALGVAMGSRINRKQNKTIVLVGDGESHEGTIWEAALVAQAQKLNNLCCIVDFNGSAAQILAHPNMELQWKSFGWEVRSIDGHSEDEIRSALSDFYKGEYEKPFAIIAHTIKGKGVSFLETHGPWHHKIPNEAEYEAIMKELEK